MAKKTTIVCDVKGCDATVEMTALAGSLQNWVRRDVSDSVNKRMVEGMRDFGAAVTYYFCPEHAERLEEVASPPIHPEVLKFKNQKED
jgi:hypothetical protein